jgi:hypothetical protein
MDNIGRYGVVKKEIREIDLRDACMQYAPNSKMVYSFCYEDGNLDTGMLNSPHCRIAKIYFKNGSDWLKKNYKTTEYYRMCTEFFGKKDISIKKIISICESMKKGYLREGYEEEYPTVLEEPFAFTRYERNVPMVKYEVFTGHHRIGAMLALGMKRAKVIIGKDSKPGSCYSEGKIHKLCIGD